MTDKQTALRNLLVDAPAIIRELGDKFDSQQFLREAMYKHQHEYIAFLSAYSGEERPVHQAHTALGRQLREIAEREGYTVIGEERHDSIFDKPSTTTVYQRRSK